MKCRNILRSRFSDRKMYRPQQWLATTPFFMSMAASHVPTAHSYDPCNLKECISFWFIEHSVVDRGSCWDNPHLIYSCAEYWFLADTRKNCEISVRHLVKRLSWVRIFGTTSVCATTNNVKLLECIPWCLSIILFRFRSSIPFLRSRVYKATSMALCLKYSTMELAQPVLRLDPSWQERHFINWTRIWTVWFCAPCCTVKPSSVCEMSLFIFMFQAYTPASWGWLCGLYVRQNTDPVQAGKFENLSISSLLRSGYVAHSYAQSSSRLTLPRRWYSPELQRIEHLSTWAPPVHWTWRRLLHVLNLGGW